MIVPVNLSLQVSLDIIYIILIILQENPDLAATAALFVTIVNAKDLPVRIYFFIQRLLILLWLSEAIKFFWVKCLYKNLLFYFG